MNSKKYNFFDVIVIGGGHAGCEAAHASCKIGAKTLLLTISFDKIAHMPCNPAIGGIGKGQIVREIDALGGLMAKITDLTGIHFRMLNKSKGPAVHSPRAQVDRNRYRTTMQAYLLQEELLEIKELMVVSIIYQKRTKYKYKVITADNQTYYSKTVVVACGTFLNGLIHIGDKSFPAGRSSELPAQEIVNSFKEMGFEIKRLKTGTPPRVKGSTLNYHKMEKQLPDEPPIPFSFSTKEVKNGPKCCWITYTNSKTHNIIKRNLKYSAMYSGKIKSKGVRYCPSLEDKIVRFSHHPRHQVFIEPEGLDTDEYYCNGISCSLPAEIQERFVRTIPGLEEVSITRYAYAIEYDFFPPHQLKSTLETKKYEGLYFAGQVNGTTGYEEAAAQGLIAGVNAALKALNKGEFVLDRESSYIGILIDDLITKEITEPYRMFTSRAENRLYLRYDNADIRLYEKAYKIGLIDNKFYNMVKKKIENINNAKKILKSIKKGNKTLYQILVSPGVKLKDLIVEYGLKLPLSSEEMHTLEVDIKYEPYIEKEKKRLEKLREAYNIKIPPNIDYFKIKELKNEAKEKLSLIRPQNLLQTLRIDGVTPADREVLLLYLKGKKRLPLIK